ncbi:hypothetical protein ACWD62_43080 [Streptomyces sp. NPDC005146]
MAMAVCVPHAVIGFGVGLWVSRLLAAPLLAVTTWVLVAFSYSTEPFWLRHVSGQYPDYLMFGELASGISLVPHVLFAGSVAAGVALLWLPLRSVTARAALAVTVALAGTFTAYTMTSTWNYNPPLLTGQAPSTCVGRDPEVCMPDFSAAGAGKARHAAVGVLADLRAAGVTRTPEKIVDRIEDGRYSRPSSDTVWRVDLTAAAAKGNLRYELVRAAVHFPCSAPRPVTARAMVEWAVVTTGEQHAHNAWLGQEQSLIDREEARREAARVHALPAAEQAAWFEQSMSTGCKKAG